MRYIGISSASEPKLRQYYISDHSKFIHASWLLKEDLDRVSVIDGENWRIAGLWDLILFRREILLRNERGQYAVEDSRIVSEGLGHYKMRNRITGEESNWSLGETTHLAPLENAQPQESVESVESVDSLDDVEETSGVWDQRDREMAQEETFSEDDQEFLDPLVKALQQALGDEDDNDD